MKFGKERNWFGKGIDLEGDCVVGWVEREVMLIKINYVEKRLR